MLSFERKVGHISALPEGEGRTVLLGGRRVAIFRSRTGRVFATQAECPHLGGPLADGIMADTTIVCPLHEFRFGLVKGQPVGNGCDALKVYPVRVDQVGEITVLLDPER